MECTEVLDERAEDWFCEWLSHTRVAGSCEQYARLEPRAAPGLRKAADKYRTVAADLMRENMDATGPNQGMTGRVRAR
jgi:hypothetical protein